MKNTLHSKTIFPLKESPKSTGSESEVEIVVGVVGEWLGHPSGPMRITREDLQTIKENFDKQKTQIVIDYEHQSLYGSVAPAAGWISELRISDDKLLAKVTWTEKAAEYIRNGEYKYVSPVYVFDSFDSKTNAYIGIKLHSVALTNTPFLDELGEVHANKSEDRKKPDEKDGDAANKTKTDTDLAAEIEKLKEQLAVAKVEAAIAANKITAEQKAWAVKYCKQDPEGFEQFLSFQKGQKLPPNNMFANKGNQGDDIDVVALAIGNTYYK